MAKPLYTIKFTYNRLPELAKKMPLATSAILTRGAYATEEGMKQRVPVRTGNLRGSIHTEGATPGSLAIDVRAGAFYAGFVEYGTRTMPPRPYTRDTCAVTFPRCIAELKMLERYL